MASGGGTAGEALGLLSQHPVDRLIRELLATGRAATPQEIDDLIERMATAPFDGRTVPVARKYRGLVYRQRALGDQEEALFYHLAQRVAAEGQWSAGTTARRYLADLRRAVRSPAAQLAIYARRGGPVAITVTPTAAVLRRPRRGPGTLPNLLVVYSADRGIIVTGYQFSTLEATGIPAEVRWLK